jgi:hypothetical protein
MLSIILAMYALRGRRRRIGLLVLAAFCAFC